MPSLAIDDISHLVAALLKRHYQEHPLFESFLTACGKVSGNLKQTLLACLAPPQVQTKARFMNVHRLVRWAERVLRLSPAGRAAQGSALAQLRACLDQLPACKAFIKRFHADALPLLACQQILKTQGLSHATLTQCDPLVAAIPSAAVRGPFAHYLQAQLATATTLGLAEVGLPLSSDPLESLFGLAKPHGTGELKDAHRIATRLPALCGRPTRAEAHQVLEISVAHQTQLTGGLTSLTKQRREVLSTPEGLDNLGREQAAPPVELLPGPKNRANQREISLISTGYKETGGPQVRQQEAPPRPARAVR